MTCINTPQSMIKNILTFLFISVTYTIFGQAFISTWNTSNQGTSSTNEITIPTNPAFTNYNYSVDWGDGTQTIDLGKDSDVTEDTGERTFTRATHFKLGDYTVANHGKCFLWL